MKKLVVLIVLAMLFVGACEPTETPTPEVIVVTATALPVTETPAPTFIVIPTVTLTPLPTQAFTSVEEYSVWALDVGDRVQDYLNELLRVNNYAVDDPTIVLNLSWQKDFYRVHLEMLLLAKEVEDAEIIPPPAYAEAHGFLLSAVEHYGNAAQILYDIPWVLGDSKGATQSMTLAISEIELGSAMVEQATMALPH